MDRQDMGEVKVNIEFYGGKSIFGGREKPLEADVTYCEAPNECPLHESGTCLMAARLGRCDCIYGRTETVTGYTKRARKYGEFRRRFEDDPAYHALSLPTRRVITMRVRDMTFLKLGSIGLEYDSGEKGIGSGYWKANDSGVWVCDPYMGRKSVWVPTEAIDAKAFEFICRQHPQALFGGEIKSFQQKDVPLIVESVRNVFPEVYEELVSANPDLAELKVDRTGMYADITTLRDGSTMTDRLGRTFTKTGMTVTCDDFDSSLVMPFGIQTRHARIEMPISEGTYVEVQSNDWVDEGTVFKE